MRGGVGNNAHVAPFNDIITTKKIYTEKKLWKKSWATSGGGHNYGNVGRAVTKFCPATMAAE